MEENVTEIKKVILKQKWENFKMGVSVRYHKVKDWCKENPQQAVAILTTVVGATTEIVKVAVKHNDKVEDRELEELKRRSVYDPSSRRYYTTTRDMTNRDYRELEKRKDSGMRTGEALEDMGILED